MSDFARRRFLHIAMASAVALPILGNKSLGNKFAGNFALAAAQSDVTLDALEISTTGKLVWVDFWATWCAPCRVLLPALLRLQQMYDTDELEVIAVSVDADAEQAESYLSELAPGLRFLHDANAERAKVFGLQSLPTSFLFESSGKLLEVHRGIPPVAGDPTDFYAAVVRNHRIESVAF